MTGFADATGHQGALSWRWEAKSVNGRSLDLRLRTPPGFDGLEPPARKLAAERFQRGAFQISLTVETEGRAAGLTVDPVALAAAVRIAKQVEAETGLQPARVDGLLALKGVIVAEESGTLDEVARAARDAAILESLGLALDAQLAELMGSSQVSPDRLAQEVALLATKADVREELDRLTAHVQDARALIKEGKGVGRKLDFLAQEFNREANTLCSKSSDIALTRVGLKLKAVIDQFREQSQNVE
jgi:uncharacterized protein YicC (UPF0701 family)